MSAVITILFAGHSLLLTSFVVYFLARRAGLTDEPSHDHGGALVMAGKGAIGLYLVYAEICLYRFWQLLTAN